jgi:hypothetical protein
VKVFIFFLVIAFLIGGSSRRLTWARKPWIFAGFCVVVAASYWSRRVIG